MVYNDSMTKEEIESKLWELRNQLRFVTPIERKRIKSEIDKLLKTQEEIEEKTTPI
jgi:hypothetical protein